MQPSGARLERSHSVLAMAGVLECCAAGSGDTANWAMLAGAKPMRVKAATRSWRALSNTALGAPEWAWLSPDTTSTAHLEKSAACTVAVSDSRKPKPNRKRLIPGPARTPEHYATARAIGLSGGGAIRRRDSGGGQNDPVDRFERRTP